MDTSQEVQSAVFKKHKKGSCGFALAPDAALQNRSTTEEESLVDVLRQKSSSSRVTTADSRATTADSQVTEVRSPNKGSEDVNGMLDSLPRQRSISPSLCSSALSDVSDEALLSNVVNDTEQSDVEKTGGCLSVDGDSEVNSAGTPDRSPVAGTSRRKQSVEKQAGKKGLAKLKHAISAVSSLGTPQSQRRKRTGILGHSFDSHRSASDGGFSARRNVRKPSEARRNSIGSVPNRARRASQAHRTMRFSVPGEQRRNSSASTIGTSDEGSLALVAPAQDSIADRFHRSLLRRHLMSNAREKFLEKMQVAAEKVLEGEYTSQEMARARFRAAAWAIASGAKMLLTKKYIVISFFSSLFEQRVRKVMYNAYEESMKNADSEDFQLDTDLISDGLTEIKSQMLQMEADNPSWQVEIRSRFLDQKEKIDELIKSLSDQTTAATRLQACLADVQTAAQNIQQDPKSCRDPKFLWKRVRRASKICTSVHQAASGMMNTLNDWGRPRLPGTQETSDEPIQDIVTTLPTEFVDKLVRQLKIRGSNDKDVQESVIKQLRDSGVGSAEAPQVLQLLCDTMWRDLTNSAVTCLSGEGYAQVGSALTEYIDDLETTLEQHFPWARPQDELEEVAETSDQEVDINHSFGCTSNDREDTKPIAEEEEEEAELEEEVAEQPELEEKNKTSEAKGSSLTHPQANQCLEPSIEESMINEASSCREAAQDESGEMNDRTLMQPLVSRLGNSSKTLGAGFSLQHPRKHLRTRITDDSGLPSMDEITKAKTNNHMCFSPEHEVEHMHSGAAIQPRSPRNQRVTANRQGNKADGSNVCGHIRRGPKRANFQSDSNLCTDDRGITEPNGTLESMNGHDSFQDIRQASHATTCYDSLPSDCQDSVSIATSIDVGQAEESMHDSLQPSGYADAELGVVDHTAAQSVATVDDADSSQQLGQCVAMGDTVSSYLSQQWDDVQDQKQRCAGRSVAWLCKLTKSPLRLEGLPRKPSTPHSAVRDKVMSVAPKRPVFLVADSQVLTSSMSKFRGGGLCLRPKSSPVSTAPIQRPPQRTSAISPPTDSLSGKSWCGGKKRCEHLFLPVLAGSSRPATALSISTGGGLT